MSKLPTTPNNLKQPSPDNNGLAKEKPVKVEDHAAEVNRDVGKLSSTSQKKEKSKK